MMLQLNFRYSTKQTDISLKQAVADIFAHHNLQPDIQWRLNGQPFLTNKGHLLTSCIDAICHHTKTEPELSTSGGTSDGRFIAPYGVEVVELGPVNATIHQVNECVALKDLERLSLIYYSVLEDIFKPQATTSN